MKILNEYPGRHHYFDEYNKTSYFCLNCGTKNVWEGTSEDYYFGPNLMCINCEVRFTMQGPYAILPESKNEVGMLEQLKSGVTNAPSTPKGR